MPSISNRGIQMPSSPIRKLVPYAEQAKSEGIHVYHLNIGQPDIKTPKIALNAVKNNNIDVLGYSRSEGSDQYREKLAKYYKSKSIDVEANNIIIKVRGLGSDDDGSLYTDADPNTIQKFSKQKAEEDYENTVDLIPGMPENFMGGEDYLAYGDRQTCTIIVNNRPEIFATSPNAGVYQRDSRYNLIQDGYHEQFTNFAKVNLVKVKLKN